jgi:hypothetical protein
MKKKEETPATPECIVYEGPYPQIRVTSLPVIGEIALVRGEPRQVGSAEGQVPKEAAAALIASGKVVAKTADAKVPVAAAAAGVSIALLITAAMVEQLKGLGYDQTEINAMTPQQANDVIASGKRSERK